MEYTLVVFPVSRASAWEWIAGTNSPQLSATGETPASHRWFSLQPTADEDARIEATLTADETRLAVDLDTDSPQSIIEAATGLQPLQPPTL